MEDRERLTGWQGWLGRLQPVVARLLESRALWNDLRSHMVLGNPDFGHAPSILLSWYVDSTIIQVRRLVDTDDRTWSLMRLLCSIHQHAHIVSLELLTELTGDPDSSRRNLAEIVGGGLGGESPPEQLTASAVARDIKRLHRASRRIVRIGHGYVAHLDETPREAESQLGAAELANTDQVIEELYLRYRRLLLAADLDFSIDAATVGWRRFVDRVGAPLQAGDSG